MRPALFAFILIKCASAFCGDNHFGKDALDKVLAEHWQNTSYRLDHATHEIKSDFLNIKNYSQEEFLPGTAYGAKASVILESSFTEIENFYANKGSLAVMGNSIPTFQKFELIDGTFSTDHFEAFLSLIIKVPLAPDIPVKDRITYAGKEHTAQFDWYQDDVTSSLLWNRGSFIFEPYGKNETLATIYAFHVLKKENALSFLIRPAGAAFAIQHYSNYLISAQNTALKGLFKNKY